MPSIQKIAIVWFVAGIIAGVGLFLGACFVQIYLLKGMSVFPQSESEIYGG